MSGTGLGGEGAGSRQGRAQGCFPENNRPSHLSGVSLEGSELMFPDLVQLICAYCHTR